MTGPLDMRAEASIDAAQKAAFRCDFSGALGPIAEIVAAARGFDAQRLVGDYDGALAVDGPLDALQVNLSHLAIRASDFTWDAHASWHPGGTGDAAMVFRGPIETALALARAAGIDMPDQNELAATGHLSSVNFCFPHYFLLPVYGNAAAYRIRPLGPEETRFEIWTTTLMPDDCDHVPPREPTHLAHDDPAWPDVVRQDFTNLPRQQAGLQIDNYLITDGKSSIALDQLEPIGQTLLIDIEDSRVKRGRGVDIARALDAVYCPLPNSPTLA